MTNRLADGLLQPIRRPVSGVNHLPAEIGLSGRHHNLLRHPFVRHEHSTQRFVPTHHIGQ